MPRNERQQVKQSMHSVLNELTKAGSKLSEVGKLYEGPHPDYYEVFCTLFAGICQIHDGVQELSDAI